MLFVLTITPTITYAGFLSERKTPTIPCKGCYFAIFDKVKKDYQLTYITPNTPDMATIVKNKQEVLWVAENGDYYSPYWNWSYEGKNTTSFEFGLCANSAGIETKYECVSSFWSKSRVLANYLHYLKINTDLVDSVKKVLDKYESIIRACSYQLPDILNVDDIKNINDVNFSELEDSQKLYTYKSAAKTECLNLNGYMRVKLEGITPNKNVIAFISKKSTKAITITKNNSDVQIERINLSNDEDLFWFNKKINLAFEKDVVISLRSAKYESQKPQKLSDLNIKVEKAVQNFLAIPLIREPSLSPNSTPTLSKGEFEKEAAFKERVLLEINKREAQVITLQEKYRADVEARNKEVEKRISVKDSYADFMARRYFESFVGGLMLQNAHYDPEKEMMYADLVSTQSDFSRPLAIPIPLANNEAETIKRYIDSNSMSLGISAKFAVDRNSITLNSVELSADSKPYIAQLQAEKFSPKIVKVTLPDTQAKLDTLFQNPNLADLITIPKLSFAAKTADGSIVVDDDLANDVKNLPTAPEDAKKWLFLVAVENYKETDKVLFAKHSADLLATTLKKRLGVSERNAYVLIDGNATAGAISDKLEQMLANIKSDDTVYFYYSGHGVPDPVTSEPYILPSDKVVDFIVREKQFQLGDIYRRLSLSGASKVVAFVDSCFSGRTDNASIFKGTAPGLIRVKELDIDPTKMTVMTAGKNTQFSNAYDTKGHRMFSYFLLRSLLKSRTNTPDMNTIFQEVSVGVRDASSAKGDIYLQEPQMYGNSALPL